MHPWDVELDLDEGPESPAANVIRGEVASLVRLGGRVRVRIGVLTAELARADAQELALTPGVIARASFTPEVTRLIRRS